MLCALLTLAAYGRSLRFAFTFDDPLDLPRAEGRSVWSLFSSSEGYAYYRPIPFVLWKIAHAIQGRYSEATLHGLTLVCHILAAWLLYLLLRRLTGNHWGIVPAILFITYPFSYQAAFGAHTLFHPLMTAALLLALLLYHDARTWQEDEATPQDRARPRLALDGHWLRYGFSLLAALIGLWTHESGVIILPLIVGLELLLTIRNARSESLRSFIRLAPYAAATALFLLVWRIVPKFARPEAWSPDSLLPNARYFLQGTIWPVAAQLKRLGERFGFDPVGALWPAIVVTLPVLLALYVIGRRPTVGLVALGAAAIILFPAWAILSWVYVEDAPRLLYPAASAIAALWGLLPSLRFRQAAVTWGWRALSLLMLLLVTIQSLNFIAVRRDMWAEGTVLVHAVADVGAAHPDRPILLLNVPAWFAPKFPEYPVGHVGLTALPGYVGLGRSVYIQRGVQPPIESRGYYPDVNGWKYDFNTHGGPASLDEFAALVRRVDAIYLVEMLPTGTRIRDVGSLAPNGADRQSGGPRFGNAITLSGTEIGFADGDLTADLTWDVLAPVPGDFLPVVRVRDGGGQVVAEWRKYPLADIAAPRLWQVGDRVHDRPRLSLPATLAAGSYTIDLLWEEKTTKASLPGLTNDGTALGANGVQLGEFSWP
ncbi:MAG TPA: hypothetical protein VIL85_14755 [Thermomicrobiales bacterium]